MTFCGACSAFALAVPGAMLLTDERKNGYESVLMLCAKITTHLL